MTEINTNAVSNYNGMVISVRHRLRGWTQGLFQANYTYGHALDEIATDGFFTFSRVSLNAPQDPRNLRGKLWLGR